MFTRMKYALAACVLLIGALVLHVRYPLTLIADALMIGVTMVVLGWIEGRRGEVEVRQWRGRMPISSRYRAVESRWKLCLAITVVLYVTFISRYHTVEHFLAEQSQRTIEKQMDRLLGESKWQEAAKYLEDCLRQPLAEDTRACAQILLYKCWLHLVDTASPAELDAILSAAGSLARDDAIDQALVVNLRRHIERAQTIGRLETQIMHARQAATEALESERSQRQAAEALAGERAGQLNIQASESARQVAGLNREHAARHFATLLAWGDSLNADLLIQRDKYQESIEFGRPWQFDTHLAHKRLDAVIAAIRAQQPRDLAAGSSAKWLSFHTDRFPPTLDVEICVLNPNGQPLDGLIAKDIRVSLAGRQVSPLGVGHVAPSQQRPQILILADCSGSTAGSALAAAKAGISHLLKQLSGHADVCVLAFNSTVTPLSSWEANPQSVISRLAALQSSGGTAMYQGLDTAASALRVRPHPRLIVLFSDGKDSTGAQPAALLDRLRGEQIVVHAVGLETAEFDRAAIERLTAATGGMLATTSQTSELASRFAELSLALNAPRYRLVIPCEEVKGQLQIEIGNRNTVKLERTLDSTKLMHP